MYRKFAKWLWLRCDDKNTVSDPNNKLLAIICG